MITGGEMSPLVLPEKKSGFPWVHGVRPAVNSAADYYDAYAAAFGYARGASLLLTSRRASNLGKRMEVMLPGTDIPLTLRLGTSDISVFKEIFIDLEPDARNYELLMLNTTRFPNVHAVRAAGDIPSSDGRRPR